MILINVERGAGKTSKAIDWLLRSPRTRVILVSTEHRARRIRDEITERSVKARAIVPERALYSMVITDPTQLRGRSQTIKVWVDDLEGVVQRAIGMHDVVYATASMETGTLDGVVIG